jgi:hypothetical protein
MLRSLYAPKYSKYRARQAFDTSVRKRPFSKPSTAKVPWGSWRIKDTSIQLLFHAVMVHAGMVLNLLELTYVEVSGQLHDSATQRMRTNQVRGLVLNLLKPSGNFTYRQV